MRGKIGRKERRDRRQMRGEMEERREGMGKDEGEG